MTGWLTDGQTDRRMNNCSFFQTTFTHLTTATSIHDSGKKKQWNIFSPPTQTSSQTIAGRLRRHSVTSFEAFDLAIVKCHYYWQLLQLLLWLLLLEVVPTISVCKMFQNLEAKRIKSMDKLHSDRSLWSQRRRKSSHPVSNINITSDQIKSNPIRSIHHQVKC